MAETDQAAEDWGAASQESGPDAAGPSLVPIVPDTAPYRIAVWAMALTIVLSILGALALKYLDKEVPEMVVAVASACVGALGGMLAPNRGR